MPREFGGPSPEEMGMKPEKSQELKSFEVRQTPDGKFVANLPNATMDREDGEQLLVDFRPKKFDTKEEADAAVEEMLNSPE